MPHTTYILPYMQHLRPYMAHILQNIHLAYMWMSTYIRNICYFLYVTYMFFPYGKWPNGKYASACFRY